MAKRRRFINPDGSMSRPAGAQVRHPLRDQYHASMLMGWPKFLGLLALGYGLLNGLFATLYVLGGPDALTWDTPNWMVAFDFSIQSFATIGYGVLSPVSRYAHAIVATESFVGISYVALATGLIFARFSRPTSAVVFSRFAVVNASLDGTPALMFRCRNERANEIVQAHAHLVLIRTETMADGRTFRRFHDVALQRQDNPLFVLGWTLIHPIDETSPFHGVTQEQVRAWDAELLVIISGVDGTFSQSIHARGSYVMEEIVFDAVLADVFNVENGELRVDWSFFDQIRHLGPDGQILEPVEADVGTQDPG
jgi:inward rectifier potassium channel